LFRNFDGCVLWIDGGSDGADGSDGEEENGVEITIRSEEENDVAFG
jgi:hypothetical protein